MKIVGFVLPNLNNKEKRIGFFEENVVYDITSLFPKNVDFFTYLLEKSQKQGVVISEVLREMLRDTDKNVFPNYIFSDLDIPPNNKNQYLITPFDPPEVWGAGVTYKRSCEARERETQSKNIYDKVYEARRPEIFFKATSNRVVGPNDWVGLRNDSNWMVPESELGIVLDSTGKIIGYIIGNDMSSRDIEGENPLYLPQAKIFKNSCSLGPILALTEDVNNPNNLTITCHIYRENNLVFKESANTSQLKRSFEELIKYLIQDNYVFPGTVLLTGTCIVPPDDFALLDGDVIEVEIEKLGILRNIARKIS
jgi:2-dehydro-3-deoxy-D-arabinonate dehydratase